MFIWPRNGRDTGPGRVSQLLRTQPGDRRHAIVDDCWLWNFNFDGNLVKPEHAELMEHIRRQLRKQPFHVRIVGYADKTGDFMYNQRLSESRALMVKQWFVKRGVPEAQIPGTRLEAHGEVFSQNTKTFAKTDKERDAFFRAVNVQLFTGVLSRPIPLPEPEKPKESTIYIEPGWWDIIVGWPPRVPPRQPNDETPSNTWYIKFVDGIAVSGEAGIHGRTLGAGMRSVKIIWFNPATRMHHVGRWTGHGGSAGLGSPKGGALPILPNASVTLPSDRWQKVTFTQPHSYLDFEGEASWEEGLTGDPTLKPAKVAQPIQVNTGWQIGIPSLAERYRGYLNMTPGMTGVQDRP